jgi:hypothetical protein
LARYSAKFRASFGSVFFTECVITWNWLGFTATIRSTYGACHYRKSGPDIRTPFDQWMLAEAGVLTDSPSYHGDWQESKMKLGRTVHCPEGPRNG